ncbi:MAG: hypothetical protein M9925_13770 [Chloroflexi bacterium]|jgi:hypothetical protein|nr:hypothetical protein [Dehalococcoidia bacterium]MCO5202761.1 hypothetical protein [Chloroflexota bacterium]MCZ7577598.1 hypothetical protein [Dehalococcoidia bacterium]PWB45514.1 MAG: hypothetical protein C3F10_05940 [Dehalococcoidia bacterium]
MANQALLRKSQADMVLERAAMQIQQLLQEACAELDPFPSFPNALFTNAIECDDGGLSGDPERGCIVVCDDGELYELQMGIDHDSIELTGSWDPVTARKETLKKVELHPRDYLVYAYAGLMAVTEHLLEREAEAKP